MHESEAPAAPGHAIQESEAPGEDPSVAETQFLLRDLLQGHLTLVERVMSLLRIIEWRVERTESTIEAMQRARTSEWFQRLGSTQPTDRSM